MLKPDSHTGDYLCIVYVFAGIAGIDAVPARRYCSHTRRSPLSRTNTEPGPAEGRPEFVQNLDAGHQRSLL